MTPAQFDQYARQGYNRIPITREVLADLDTPLSAYLKLADGPYSYLFESVHGGEQWGRYSIIGLPSHKRIKIVGHQITVEVAGEASESFQHPQPLQWIEDFRHEYRVPDIEGLPRFNGGLVGYFGYETIAYIEPRLQSQAKPDPIGTPDILLMVSEDLLVFDNLSGKLLLLTHADPAQEHAYQQAQQRLDNLVVKLRESSARPQAHVASKAVQEADFVSGFTQQGFEAAVLKAKEYITDGDIMQVVLSQRMSIPFSASPLDLYRSLRCLNPSPYMFCIKLAGRFTLVGSSPEVHVRLTEGRVEIRPIAGTKRRGATPAEDDANAAELLADPKERAEHLMLVDLARNDVGRISKFGTVKVSDFMTIERYSHVMHIVSHVTGELSPDKTAFDVMRATFPAGTVSGSPKIRAMQLLNQFEKHKRGVYAGAVGYFGFDGNTDSCIALRTVVLKDGRAYVQTGAGVVADSTPEGEHQECVNKAMGMMAAIHRARSTPPLEL
ncbi:MAG: anthranilate synthase component I [Methylococcaceae bacterium]|nr:anthranilate synthase component I [Methylococcaceae bacterium]